MSNSSGRAAAGALLGAMAISGLVFFGGCPQPIDAVPCGDDGGLHPGADGGSGSDGGEVDTDAGSNERDAGVAAGTDAGTDAGVISRADAGPFSWAVIPGTGTDQTVTAIHGTSPHNVYIVTSDGEILRSTGGAFSKVLTLPGATPPVLQGVWVTPNGNVFAGGYNTLVACTNGDCAQASDFTITSTADLSPAYGSIEGLCGHGNDTVYAVGGFGGEGRLWAYDFSAGKWVVPIPNTQAGYARSCFIADNGDAFVAGAYARLLRVTPAFLAFVEPIIASDEFDPSDWLSYAVVGANGRFFATGGGKKIVERDNATRTWNLVASGNSYYENYALATFAPDEIYAAGSPDLNRSLQRFDGVKWTNIPDSDRRALPYWMTLEAMWMPDADTIFLAGERSSDAIVVMGTR